MIDHEEAAALRRAVKTRRTFASSRVARLTVHRTPKHIYAQVTDADGRAR